MKDIDKKEQTLCRLLETIKELRETRDQNNANKKMILALGIIEANLSNFSTVLNKQLLS